MLVASKDLEHNLGRPSNFPNLVMLCAQRVGQRSSYRPSVQLLPTVNETVLPSLRLFRSRRVKRLSLRSSFSSSLIADGKVHDRPSWVISGKSMAISRISRPSGKACIMLTHVSLDVLDHVSTSPPDLVRRAAICQKTVLEAVCPVPCACRPSRGSM